jgi:hypothetical protein
MRPTGVVASMASWSRYLGEAFLYGADLSFADLSEANLAALWWLGAGWRHVTPALALPRSAACAPHRAV